MTVKTADTNLGNRATIEKPFVFDDGKVYVPVYAPNTNTHIGKST
jgi:hypothetical protein